MVISVNVVGRINCLPLELENKDIAQDPDQN